MFVGWSRTCFQIPGCRLQTRVLGSLPQMSLAKRVTRTMKVCLPCSRRSTLAEVAGVVVLAEPAGVEQVVVDVAPVAEEGPVVEEGPEGAAVEAAAAVPEPVGQAAAVVAAKADRAVPAAEAEPEEVGAAAAEPLRLPARHMEIPTSYRTPTFQFPPDIATNQNVLYALASGTGGFPDLQH